MITISAPVVLIFFLMAIAWNTTRLYNLISYRSAIEDMTKDIESEVGSLQKESDTLTADETFLLKRVNFVAKNIPRTLKMHIVLHSFLEVGLILCAGMILFQ